MYVKLIKCKNSPTYSLGILRKSCKNCYLFPFIFSMFTQDYYGWVHLNCDGVYSVNMTITVVDMTL